MVFDNDELQNINIENVLDTIEQKIVSTRKTIITNLELIKIVLNTLQPISTNATIKYLASYGQRNNQRKLNKIINSL
jgi:transcriptional regulator NrdR family protein